MLARVTAHGVASSLVLLCVASASLGSLAHAEPPWRKAAGQYLPSAHPSPFPDQTCGPSNSGQVVQHELSYWVCTHTKDGYHGWQGGQHEWAWVLARPDEVARTKQA